MPKICVSTCTFCADTLVGYQIKHTEADCPLRACLSCNACGEDGHSDDTCTQAPPEYCYKNTLAKTLNAFLDSRCGPKEDDSQEAAAAAAPKKLTIELLEDEKVFREFVRARMVFEPGEGPAMKIEENKKKIKRWAKEAGVRVVFKEKKEEDEKLAANFAKYDRIYEEYNPKPQKQQKAVSAPQGNKKKL